MGSAQPDFAQSENQNLVPPAGVPAPDEDLPDNDFTGAPFRRGG